MVWCKTTRTDTIDLGIPGTYHELWLQTNKEILLEIIRHDQVLVVWNAPVPTAGRFPDLQFHAPDRLPSLQKPVAALPFRQVHDPVLPAYSDEIVQVSHLLPFYPKSAYTQTPAPAVLFSICIHHTIRPEKRQRKPHVSFTAPISGYTGSP